ncbi:MAG TPA: hypothetical protein VFP89_08045 [Propionibacteriaceae bacterium]|nr:hypothetical protein [Propionibacteriaceae bacterium]
MSPSTTNQERISVRRGQQLWGWALGSNPLTNMLVVDLTDRQREDIVQVLGGMVFERSGGIGPIAFTARLNIGVTTN